jgi:hypothetical protein
LIFGEVVDSSLFPYESGKAKAWFDKPDAQRDDVALSLEPAIDAEMAMTELFLQQLDEAIASGALPYTYGESTRIHNAHQLPGGRAIWLYPPVKQFLSEHFRDDPCACQTLTYVFGSEQDAHQDTIHLTPYPSGYMCGVWIALQDVDPGSGELFVYPGSHKSRRLRTTELGLKKVDEDYSEYHVFSAAVASLLQEEGFVRLDYRPKAGQILVWHENLVHGGAHRQDRSLPRKSIVSHYFARGSLAYYDSRGEAAALELLK